MAGSQAVAKGARREPGGIGLSKLNVFAETRHLALQIGDEPLLRSADIQKLQGWL